MRFPRLRRLERLNRNAAPPTKMSSKTSECSNVGKRLSGVLFLMSKSSFLVKLIGKSLLKTGQTNKNRKSTNEQQTEAAMCGAIRSWISLLVLLDLSAAFDTIDHKILLNSLENFVGISGSALARFNSYLSDRHQFVAVNEEVSYRSQVQCGVPQGSVLGSLLFTLYMLPLGDIIRDHGVSFHCYADDTQLYISLRPNETYQFEKLTECIADIKNWMKSNFLLLNSEKNRGVNYRT